MRDASRAKDERVLEVSSVLGEVLLLVVMNLPHHILSLMVEVAVKDGVRLSRLVSTRNLLLNNRVLFLVEDCRLGALAVTNDLVAHETPSVFEGRVLESELAEVLVLYQS